MKSNRKLKFLRSGPVLQRQRFRIGIFHEAEGSAALHLRGLDGGYEPVVQTVQVREELVRLQLGIVEGHVGLFTVRDKELIDALAADDPKIIAVAVAEQGFQLVHAVADDGTLHGEVGVVGQNDILPLRQGPGVREGFQRLAAVDDGFVDGQLAEPVQIGGDGDEQLAVLSDAPVGCDVHDSIHGWFLSYIATGILPSKGWYW